MKQALVARGKGDLAKYDPKRGVETIAMLAAAEKHYAKAKDASQLQKAIRAKLEAQAEFVYWWDSKGPGANHGAPKGNRNARKQISATADL